MAKKYYSGIGARATPLDWQKRIIRVAKYLDDKQYTLRSGNADGADRAFQSGSTNMDIYSPWPGFNGGHPDTREVTREKVIEASKIILETHPNPNYLSPSVVTLHSRSCYILMGEDLRTPSDFVVYYRPLNVYKGGTTMAIKLADHFNIPSYNLADKEELEMFKEDLEFLDLVI